MMVFAELQNPVALGLHDRFFRCRKFKGGGENDLAGFFEFGMAVGKFEFIVQDGADGSVQSEQFNRDEVVAHLPSEGAGVSGDTAADGSGNPGAVRQIADFVFDGEERQIVEQGVAGNGDAAAGGCNHGLF